MFEPNLTSRWVRPKRNFIPLTVKNPDRELWRNFAKELLGVGFYGLALCPTRDVDSAGGQELNTTVFKLKVIRSSEALHPKGTLTYVNNSLLEPVNPIAQWVLDTIEGGMEIY